MKKYRSLLFLPAHEEKYYQSIIHYQPDCVILDLEDGVPKSQKEFAKKLICNKLNTKFNGLIDVFIRIRNESIEYAKDDIDFILRNKLNIKGVVIPKVENSVYLNDIINFIEIKEKEYDIYEKCLNIILLIETPLGVINSYDLAKVSNRIVALGFGGEDYITSINGEYDINTLLFPRCNLIASSKANQLQCIDTVYIDINNESGFIEELNHIKKLGFDGKFLIHPSQIERTNRTLGYTKEEIDRLKAIVKQFRIANDRNKSVLLLNGQLVEEPHIKKYLKIIKDYEGE